MPTGARKYLSLPEPVYRRALRMARQKHQSVPDFIESLLEEKEGAETASAQQSALEQSFAMADRAARTSPGRLILNKDELHEDA